MSNHTKYIAVHGGAGSHSHDREGEVKKALRLACVAALKVRANVDASESASRCPDRSERTPLDMVVDSIAILEDDPWLNAGYGSNLTLYGTVECDAAVMDGRSGKFGSVGAVSGVKNPILLARAILENSKVPDPLGRVSPLTLVSEGARLFALSNKVWCSIETVEPDSLVSTRARNDWLKWKARLEDSHAVHTDSTNRDIQDTVGAVACQTSWMTSAIAAGVSSGGILLKHPGRIGEAATFGAGCWAQHFPGTGIRIACSISGTGEYISRTMLARVIMDYFRLEIAKSEDIDCHDIIYNALLFGFCAPCREHGVNDPDVGVLLLMAEETPMRSSVRLFCAFTTPSMAIAYASSVDPRPKVHILRQPKKPTSRRADTPRIFITAMTMQG